ncbi:MAG: hypothetical protein JXA62_03025 [Candidatus Aminicenantes bacterium]|nr:hypothetical protein [Candidatus Aminicenantes bacterium]
MSSNMSRRNALAVCGILVVMMLHSGCSLHKERIKQGLDYSRMQDYARAEAYFTDLVRRFPQKTEYRTLLLRVRMSRYYFHLYRARSLRRQGEENEAIAEYRAALRVFPGNQKLQTELDEYLGRGAAGTERQRFQSEIQPPVRLGVDATEKVSLKLRSMPVTRIFKALGKSFGVNFIFDKDFRDFVYSLDVEEVSFEQVLNQLCLVAAAKFRVLDPSTVLIFSDTPYKNRAYALSGVKVFPLSSIKAEEAKKLVLSVFRESRPMVQEDASLNTLIVKGDLVTLKEVEQFLAQVDKAKAEVELDVEILEVNRSLLQEIGAGFGNTLFELNMGTEGDSGAISSTFRLDRIKDTNFFMTVPSVAMNLLETSGDNRLIAKPNLRGIHGEEITFMVGDKIPIPQTQFQSFAAGGVNNTPVTTYRYENVGLEIKITPFVHQNDEVTLEIELSMTFVTSYVDQFPVLGKREIKNMIRLKEGETNIIGGFIRDEERDIMKGIPLIAHLPILGKLFGSTNRNLDQTDLIFSISPRVIRRRRHTAGDGETIWTNTLGGVEGGAADAPQEETVGPVPPPASRPGERTLPESSREGGRIFVSPASNNIRVNQPVLFTLRMAGLATPVARLSLAGEFPSGNVEILSVNTSFLSPEQARTLKNFSGANLDLGFNFTPPRNEGMLAQVQVKFSATGSHTFNISNIQAFSDAGEVVELEAPAAVEIEVK